MGPVAPAKSLTQFLVALSFLTLAGTGTGRAENFERLPKSVCVEYFKKILKNTDEDLALIPFAERSLSDLFSVLNAPHRNERKLIEAIYEADIRRMAYRLRALSSSVESVDHELFALLNTEFKVLEKMIGDSVFEMEMLTAIRTDPLLKPHLTPAIEMMFYGRVAATEARMLQNMRRLGWTGKMGGGSAYRRILRAFERAEPVTKISFLKKNVLKLQAKKLRTIHEDIATGVLDPNEIEDGVHELRRQVREALLTFTTYHGMFYLDDSIRFAQIANREFGPMRWLAPLDEALLKKPIALPKNDYIALMYMVKDLGELKAGDGVKEFIVKAIEDMPRNLRARIGVDLKNLHAAASRSKGAVNSLAQTRLEAKRQFDAIVQSRILLSFADYLDQAAKRL